MKKYLVVFLAIMFLGCIQQGLPPLTVQDVPVPDECELSSRQRLPDYEYKNIIPIQLEYSCSQSVTVDQVYEFYYYNMTGWEKSKSVKTEYLTALVFSRDAGTQSKEILGVTYTGEQGFLILAKGYSDEVIDTGWV